MTDSNGGRIHGSAIDQLLDHRRVVLLVTDEGDGAEPAVTDPRYTRGTDLLGDRLVKLRGSHPHVVVALAHRHRNATALERWGVPRAPLAGVVVVDGVITCATAIEPSEIAAQQAVRALVEALDAWPQDPTLDRAAEAALADAETQLAAGDAEAALVALHGPKRPPALPALRTAEQLAAAESVTARALAEASRAEASTWLLAWDRRDPRPVDDATRYCAAVANSTDRGSATTLLERWCERHAGDGELALVRATHAHAQGALETALEEARRSRKLLDDGSPGRPLRDARRITIAALRGTDRLDEALVELACLRGEGGWTPEDEAEYDGLRERGLSPALRAGRGRSGDAVEDLVEGARRLGRTVVSWMGRGEAPITRDAQLLGAAPRLLRHEQVDAALNDLHGPLLVPSLPDHGSLYRLWAQEGEILDALLQGPAPTPSAAPAWPPTPRLPVTPDRLSNAEVEAYVAFVEWWLEGPLTRLLGETRLTAARTIRWALHARPAGIPPGVVSAYEAVAREARARAEALEEWLREQLAGDLRTRAHAGWHAVAESCYCPHPELADRHAALGISARDTD